MSIGFMVSWFHDFMVSFTPSLDSETLIGFMIFLSLYSISGQQDVERFLVSRFHGFVHSISGHRDDDRFCDFMVYLSMHSNSGQQDVEIKILPTSRCPEMECTKP